MATTYFYKRTCPVCGVEWTAERRDGKPPTGPTYCARHKTAAARDQRSRNATGAVQWGAWRDDAACAGAPVDIFFGSRSDVRRVAAVYCNHCPVRAACAAEALANRETFGLWAGVNLTGGSGSLPSQREKLQAVTA